MSYKICALIPTYNHYTQLPQIVRRLRAAELPVFIVDDGSNQQTQSMIDSLEGIEKLRLPINCGKGAAVEAGIKWVAEDGFTHAFQIDADGQHSLDELEAFIEISKQNPLTLISGKPVYDSTIPLGRKIGRWFTHVWVWIETLSFNISDSMCGFRIYPVQAALNACNRSSLGKRMEFDTEIMVRMFWKGTPVMMHPVKVCYPEENHSNFKMLNDNWRITKMHTRLVFSMLAKLPSILSKRRQITEEQVERNKTSWSNLSERGTIFGIIILAACYRLCGRTVCSIIGAPVVLYFFLTGREQRKASSQFLDRVFKVKNLGRQARWTDGLKHFMSFFQAQLDKFAAWSGRLKADCVEFIHPDYIHKVMTGKQGSVMFVSHLGCMELCRNLMSDERKKKMHILMHTKNAQSFNRVLAYFNPQSSLNILEVTEMGAETILFLKDRIEHGDWVVIAADRTAVSENPRVAYAPFLGEEAPFPQGPYILASLLQCPVYTAMAVRSGSKYRVSIELFAEQIILSRGRKEACISAYAQQYAQYLEKACLEHPTQWFNFFDFWRI